MSATMHPVTPLIFGSPSYMQDLRGHFQKEDSSRDFYSSSSVKMVNFDGSFESFNRLDQFFQAFKEQIGELPKNFETDPRILNTFCLIASYIGQFICQKLHIEENWIMFDELKTHFPSFQSVSSQFYYSYGLIGHHQLFLPLAYIYQHFFQGSHLCVSENIETCILNAQISINEKAEQYSEQMHAIQTMYMKNYQLFCGLAFQDLIQQANLDYSLGSLERLDELMHQIRPQIVSASVFLQDSKNFYFFYFLIGYIGRVIAQHARTSLHWFSAPQASSMIHQTLANDLNTCRIAQINQSIFFISQHVNQFLFDPVTKKSTSAYSQEILAILKPRVSPFYLTENHQQLNLTESPFYAAFYRAGQLASYVLLHIHGIQPRQSRADKTQPVTLPPGNNYLSHANTPIEELHKQMLMNKENFAYNVLAHETSAYLPHLHTDAIALSIYNYGQHPMNIHLIIPFFQAFDYRGFCILQPYFCAKDLPTSKKMPQIAQAMGAFFKGIGDSEYGRPESYQIWKNHYHPQRLPYPENMQKHTLALNA